MSIEKIERLIEKLTKPHTQMHRSGYRVEKSPPSIQREAASAIRALLDELSRLREALKPFGRENDLPSNLPDSTRLTITFAGQQVAHATFGDFRAAARALSEREGQE